MVEQDSIVRLEGKFEPGGKVRFGIVASRFNQQVVDKLLDGALEALLQHGVGHDQITVVRVPGAWEIPFACQRLAGLGHVVGIVALGAVIRGATPHFDLVASESASGCARVMLQTGVPIGLGILTTETTQQALERAGGQMGNKGWEAALSVLETSSLVKMLADNGP